MTDMKNQRYGVEIEMVGINNRRGAEVLAQVFGTNSYRVGGYYDKYGAKDQQGREWVCMDDGSLNGSTNTELVTPVLGWDDIELLQEVVRAMRHAGGRADRSCGVHVHVGAEEHTPSTLRNLLNLVYTHYDLLEKSLGFGYRSRWCKKANARFMGDINRVKPSDMEKFAEYWYGCDSSYDREASYRGKVSKYNADCSKGVHYHGSRYQLVNLHSYFQNKGVEFRAFNGTVHAGEIKAYVQFCCALNAKSINLKYASLTERHQRYSERAQMQDWLWQMGLTGKDDEFKTVRHHLSKNLSTEMRG